MIGGRLLYQASCPIFVIYLTHMLAARPLLPMAFASLAYVAYSQTTDTTYVVPVVFHVLHNNGPENISDAQIMDALDFLNRHFDAPTNPVEPPFDAIAADMDIEFCLASMDPNGIPTSGIDRIQTNVTSEAGSAESYLDQWPPDRYLNVWTVHVISSGAAGTTLSPLQAEAEPERDGVMILANRVGTIGSSTFNDAPVLSYLVGKYFNLKRTNEIPVGNTDCGDDEVADTPIHANPIVCTSDNVCDPLPINIQNIMVGAFCTFMFTQGQRDRVHAALNSSVASRNNLWSAANLSATGCSAPTSVEDERPSSPVRWNHAADGRLVLENLLSRPLFVFVRDNSGRLLAEGSLSPGAAGIWSTSGWSRGLYFLQYAADGRTEGSFRFVVP